MLIRAVVRNPVDDDFQSESVGLLDQCIHILKSAKDRIDICVVGHVVAEVVHGGAEEWRDPDRVDPQRVLQVVEDLRVEPARAIVIEDAIAGVAAGAAGGFGLVIGVARNDNETDLLAAGAHIVVTDLDVVAVSERTG